MSILSSFLCFAAAFVAINAVVRKMRKVRGDYQCYYQQDVQQFTNNH